MFKEPLSNTLCDLGVGDAFLGVGDAFLGVGDAFLGVGDTFLGVGDAFLTAGEALFATRLLFLLWEGGEGALFPATRLLDRLPLALEGVTLLLLPLPLFALPVVAGCCCSSSSSSARKRAGVTPWSHSTLVSAPQL